MIQKQPTKTSLSEFFEFDGSTFTAFLRAVPAPRMTQAQARLVHAPDHKLSKSLLAVKNGIVRYNKFKTDLQLIASLAKFRMQETQHVVIGFATDKQ